MNASYAPSNARKARFGLTPEDEGEVLEDGPRRFERRLVEKTFATRTRVPSLWYSAFHERRLSLGRGACFRRELSQTCTLVSRAIL